MTQWGWTILPPICRRHFHMHFLERNLLYSDWDFIEMCSFGFNRPFIDMCPIEYTHCVVMHSFVIVVSSHDDVIKWKHFPRHWPFVRGIPRSPVNSPHKGQSRGALMFSLICAWINGWVNNREAGDLRRHRTRYDVIVMYIVDARHLFTHVFQGYVTGAGEIAICSWSLTNSK